VEWSTLAWPCLSSLVRESLLARMGREQILGPATEYARAFGLGTVPKPHRGSADAHRSCPWTEIISAGWLIGFLDPVIIEAGLTLSTRRVATR